MSRIRPLADHTNRECRAIAWDVDQNADGMPCTRGTCDESPTAALDRHLPTA